VTSAESNDGGIDRAAPDMQIAIRPALLAAEFVNCITSAPALTFGKYRYGGQFIDGDG
jgi:hypothetical protein